MIQWLQSLFAGFKPPELLKFNLVFAGPGTARIKDIELHATPLKG
jgi:hypothetical protein